MQADRSLAKSRKIKAEDALASKMPKLEPMETTAEETKEKVEVEVNDASFATRESTKCAHVLNAWLSA